MSIFEESVSTIRTWIGDNHKRIGLTVGGILVTWKVGGVLIEKVNQYKRRQALKKWENGPQDVVILHTPLRGKTIPNLSPFAMKLETYLRIAKIPYEVDFEVPFGPLGKTPWITLNGEHVTDSQLIIKFLHAKLHMSIENKYSEEQRATAKAVRIMMDEYLYWGLGLWRYVYSEGQGLDELFDISPLKIKVFYRVFSKRVNEMAWAQGIGRHSKEQVIEMMKEVLKTASLILGKKNFLLGDEPCEEDCTFFGCLGMVLWGAPGSPYEKYLKEELPNLKNYCERMKTHFWRDWDQCLSAAAPATIHQSS